MEDMNITPLRCTTLVLSGIYTITVKTKSLEILYDETIAHSNFNFNKGSLFNFIMQNID